MLQSAAENNAVRRHVATTGTKARALLVLTRIVHANGLLGRAVEHANGVGHDTGLVQGRLRRNKRDRTTMLVMRKGTNVKNKSQQQSGLSTIRDPDSMMGDTHISTLVSPPPADFHSRRLMVVII